LELCSADLPYRDILYYPVVLNDLTSDMNLLENVNCRALEMAQNQQLIIVFMYYGHDNILVILQNKFVEQLVDHDLPLSQIRFLSSVKLLSKNMPFIFFPFQEMEAYMDSKENTLIKTINEDTRENIFTCNISKDTAHSRLFGASIWYHNLAQQSFFTYANQTEGSEVVGSNIYQWRKHWTATATLMDMFGQQLPMGSFIQNNPDYYNKSYWNITVMPDFSNNNLSVSKEVFAPILNLQPFILVGPAGSLKLLRSLGYETFRTQVNEEYDTITDDETRMQALFRLTYEMANFKQTDLDILNNRLVRTIEFNQQHLLASKKFKLISLLNTLKSVQR